jgi:glutamate-1-semialdehyde 2,1-aminomutase
MQKGYAAGVAKAALEEVLTQEAYVRVEDLATTMAQGLAVCFRKLELSWRAFQLGPRIQLFLSNSLQRNATEAAISLSAEWIDTRRIYLANRGIWDAIASAGPQVSFAHVESDCNEYIRSISELLDRIKT